MRSASRLPLRMSAVCGSNRLTPSRPPARLRLEDRRVVWAITWRTTGTLWAKVAPAAGRRGGLGSEDRPHALGVLPVAGVRASRRDTQCACGLRPQCPLPRASMIRFI